MDWHQTKSTPSGPISECHWACRGFGEHPVPGELVSRRRAEQGHCCSAPPLNLDNLRPWDAVLSCLQNSGVFVPFSVDPTEFPSLTAAVWPSLTMLGSHLNFRLTKPSSAGASGSGPDIRQNGECLVKFSEDFSPDVNGVDVEDGTTIRCILMQKTVASEFSAGQGSEPPETLWDVMLLGTHLEDEDASTPKIELLRKLFLCSKGLLKGVPESSLRQVTPLPAEQLKKRLENLDTLSKGIKAFAAHVPFIVEQTERRALLEGEQSKLSQEQHDPAEVSNGVKGTGGKRQSGASRVGANRE